MHSGRGRPPWFELVELRLPLFDLDNAQHLVEYVDRFGSNGLSKLKRHDLPRRKSVPKPSADAGAEASLGKNGKRSSMPGYVMIFDWRRRRRLGPKPKKKRIFLRTNWGTMCCWIVIMAAVHNRLRHGKSMSTPHLGCLPQGEVAQPIKLQQRKHPQDSSLSKTRDFQISKSAGVGSKNILPRGLGWTEGPIRVGGGRRHREGKSAQVQRAAVAG